MERICRELRVIRQKGRFLLSFFCILFLLPYIITIFVNGKNMELFQGQTAVYIKNQGHPVKWEEYFTGVICKEIPETYEVEALKAQAVLVRTGLYQELEEQEGNSLEEVYMTEEERKILWGTEYDKYNEKLQMAVDETRNQVLRYNGSYALVPFHQFNNGSTRIGEEVLGTADYPYLTLQACPKDMEAEEALAIHTYTYQEVVKCCLADMVAVTEDKAKEGLNINDFEVQETDSAGYVKTIRVANTFFTGDEFREKLGLPSADFSVQEMEGKLRITCKGKGHGLGMSLWTANVMAAGGKRYDEIIQYFFPGTVLEDGGEIFLKIE